MTEPRKCPKCESVNVKFSHTREDWFDGDEDDYYRCQDCNHLWSEYVPR